MANDTWSGVSGDWKIATLWNGGTIPGPADTAIFNTTSFYTATIGTTGTTESQTVAGVTLADANATLQLTAGSTLTTTGTLTLSAGELAIGGVLNGGTINAGLGAIAMQGGTLAHATIQGGVTAGGYQGTLDVVGGLAFQTSASGPGELSLNSYYGTLALIGSQTLSGGEIQFQQFGFDDVLLAGTATPVTLASNFIIDDASYGTLAGSFVNQGTIVVEF